MMNTGEVTPNSYYILYFVFLYDYSTSLSSNNFTSSAYKNESNA